jgi:hypothetical protein
LTNTLIYDREIYDDSDNILSLHTNIAYHTTTLLSREK